jgi:hypothetical protein
MFGVCKSLKSKENMSRFAMRLSIRHEIGEAGVMGGIRHFEACCRADADTCRPRRFATRPRIRKLNSARRFLSESEVQAEAWSRALGRATMTAAMQWKDAGKMRARCGQDAGKIRARFGQDSGAKLQCFYSPMSA